MKFEFYHGMDGWRWRLVARNSRIVADSGEAYKKRSGVIRAINAVIVGMLKSVRADGRISMVEVKGPWRD